MTYSYYKPGGAMRAFALILASALIVALVWFVSYKNGCVTCSKTDSGTDGLSGISCQACPDPDNIDIPNKLTGRDKTGDKTGSDTDTDTAAVDTPAAVTESKKVSFEIVLDGRSTRFEVDLDTLGDRPLTITSEDGQTNAVFEKGSSTDIRVTINSPEASAPVAQPEPEPQNEEPAVEFVDEPAEEPAADAASEDNELQPAQPDAPAPASTIQNNSDIASTDDTQEPAKEPESAPAEETPSPAAFNTLLPPVSLLKGESFGMDGKVLAIGRGCDRRDVIIAVIPPEGNCMTLLCDTLCTQKTINAVKDKYPDRIVYTYTIDREYFVNLRGNSYFELYNCADSVELQSGMEKPEWLTGETVTISDEEVNTYIAKNELERFHVKGTDGCLVICENDDVFRYNRA